MVKPQMDQIKFLKANIKKEVWETLINAGFLKQFGSGEAIYVQNQNSDGLVCLISGKAKTSILFTDGTEKIFNILEAPAIIGETAAFDGGCNVCSATALSKVEVVYVPPEEARKILTKHPEVALSLIESIGQKLRNLALQTEDLSAFNISRRLARMLVNFRQYGLYTYHDDDHSLVITHEELASFVGTTRPNVTAFLNEFAKKGYIEIKRGRVIIRDHEALREFADGEY